MTLEEAQEILAGVEYKPGTYFSLHRDDQENIFRFNLAMHVQDVLEPENKILVTQSSRWNAALIRGMSERQFCRMIRENFVGMEMHEVDEWFKLRGDRIYDPHKGEK